MAENKQDQYPVLEFKTAAALHKWFTKNYAVLPGIWLKIAKLESGIKTVTYKEALEIALCYGWIDGVRRKLDAQYFVQKFTPRRKGSIWSLINRNKAEELIGAGKMQAPGLAAIEEAKKNGRWDNAYASFKNIEVPPALKQALKASPKAARFFKALDAQNRYAILFRIHNAKKAETKSKKIAAFVLMMEKGELIYR